MPSAHLKALWERPKAPQLTALLRRRWKLSHTCRERLYWQEVTARVTDDEQYWYTPTWLEDSRRSGRQILDLSKLISDLPVLGIADGTVLVAHPTLEPCPRSCSLPIVHGEQPTLKRFVRLCRCPRAVTMGAKWLPILGRLEARPTHSCPQFCQAPPSDYSAVANERSCLCRAA